MRQQRALLVGVVVCLFALTASAQQTAITNADIVKMVKAGLSESIVISAIEAAPLATFELTPDALIKLKADGVSDRALAAMLTKAAAGVARAPSPVTHPASV